MKAIILCSGYGTRLRPLTLKTPKAMLPIKGKPFLEYVLEYLQKYNVRDYIIKLSYKSEQFLKYDGFKKYNIEWVVDDKPLGTAGEVKACAKHLGNDNNFIIYYGDTLTNLNLDEVVEKHTAEENILTMVAYQGERSKYGVYYFNSKSECVRFKEKPMLPHWVNCPIMIANKEFLQYCEIGKDISKDIAEGLEEKMGVYQAKDLTSIDIGSIDEYKKYAREGFKWKTN